jgi:hypothetical protein
MAAGAEVSGADGKALTAASAVSHQWRRVVTYNQ